MQLLFRLWLVIGSISSLSSRKIHNDDRDLHYLNDSRFLHFSNDGMYFNLPLYFPGRLHQETVGALTTSGPYLNANNLAPIDCLHLSSCIFRLSSRIILEIRLLSLFLGDGDIVIDSISDVGYFSMGLFQYNNEITPIYVVIIESSSGDRNILSDNIVRNGFWNKSLIVSGFECDLISNTKLRKIIPIYLNDSKKISVARLEEEDKVASWMRVHSELMQGECPSIIRFASERIEQVEWELICRLYSSIDLLDSCAPVVYLSLPSVLSIRPPLPSIQRSAVEFFQQALSIKYILRWVHLQDDRLGLLAVPDRREAIVDELQALLVDEYEKEVGEGEEAVVSFENVPEMAISHSEEGERGGEEPLQVRVWLSDLLEMDSPLLTLPYEEELLVVAYPSPAADDGVPSSSEDVTAKEELTNVAQDEVFHRLCALRCALWTGRLCREAASSLGSAVVHWAEERLSLLSSCATFCQQRLRHSRDLMTWRGEGGGGVLPIKYYRSVVESARDTEIFVSSLPLPLRSPFRFELQEDLCGTILAILCLLIV